MGEVCGLKQIELTTQGLSPRDVELGEGSKASAVVASRLRRCVMPPAVRPGVARTSSSHVGHVIGSLLMLADDAGQRLNGW